MSKESSGTIDHGCRGNMMATEFGETADRCLRLQLDQIGLHYIDCMKIKMKTKNIRIKRR